MAKKFMIERGLLMTFFVLLSLITNDWSLGHSVYAEVPRLLAYQGRLTESNGSPLLLAHEIVFRIYDAASGGSKLWEEDHPVNLTADDNGIFSLVLGSLQPFGTLDFNQPLWLALEIDGKGEMTPRQRLTAVGYAINADTLDGVDSTQLLRSDIDAASSGQLTLTRAGTPLVIRPSAAPAADTKLIDVQNSGKTSKFSVDYEGDVMVAGDLVVTGVISGATSVNGTSSAAWTIGSGTDAAVNTVSLLFGQSSGGQESLVFEGGGSGDFVFSDDVRLSRQSRLRLEDASGSAISLTAPGSVTAYTLTLPGAVGSAGQLLSTDASGNLSWVSDANSGGTITGVTAGAGLTGGGAGGSVTLDVGAGSGIQTGADDVSLKLTSGAGLAADATGLSLLRTCANGELLKWNASTSAWGCAADTDTNAGGTITAVVAGSGLTGGGAGGSVTLTLSTPVTVANGGTGAASLTSGGLVTGQGSSALTTTSVGKALEIVSSALNVSCMGIGGTSDSSHSATFQMGAFGMSATNDRLDHLWPVPRAGTVKDLRAYVEKAPGAVGDSWTVTVRKNGANTSLACTVSGSNQSCSATGSVTFAAGDRLGAEFVETGTAAATTGSGWSSCYVPD